MTRKNRFLLGLIALVLPAVLTAQNPQGESGSLQHQINGLQEKVDRMPKISGFAQVLFEQPFENGKAVDNTFRMRRVRLSVDGKLTQRLKYKIQGDFVNSPMLVDAYLKYTICPEFALQIGQFKTPFTLESPINPLNLEIFDYGDAVRGLVGYKDVCCVGKLGRDIGIMATGTLFPVEDKGFGIVDYSLGIFNGNGINIVDNNMGKDFAGRIEIHPMLKALTVTGSLYYGDYFVSDVQKGTRNRYSFGLQYNDDRFVVRSEYLSGETGKFADVVPFQPENFYSEGYYAVAGYWFQFGKKEHLQRLMPVLRFESFDKNTRHVGNNVYTVGLNYWPVKSLNLKLDYSLIQGKYQDNNEKHRVVAILSYKF